MSDGKELLENSAVKSSEKSEPLDPKKIEATKLSENIQLMEAARMAAKKDELSVIEKRIDEKLIELKKFVELTKVQGETFAGSNLTKSKERIEIEECNKMLEGTGFELPLPKQ